MVSPRYYTRSSTGQPSGAQLKHRTYEHRTYEGTVPLPSTPTYHLLTPQPLATSDNASVQNPEDAKEMQEIDQFQLGLKMDQLAYASSAPIQAPFPSPSLKSIKPFFPFLPPQPATQFSHSEACGWSHHDPWQQGGTGGMCILAEAANRAQMAILVDDMGRMGLEHPEQV